MNIKEIEKRKFEIGQRIFQIKKEIGLISIDDKIKLAEKGFNWKKDNINWKRKILVNLMKVDRQKYHNEVEKLNVELYDNEIDYASTLKNLNIEKNKLIQDKFFDPLMIEKRYLEDELYTIEVKLKMALKDIESEKRFSEAKDRQDRIKYRVNYSNSISFSTRGRRF